MLQTSDSPQRLVDIVLQVPRKVNANWLSPELVRDVGRYPVTNEEFDATPQPHRYANTDFGRIRFMRGEEMKAGDIILFPSEPTYVHGLFIYDSIERLSQRARSDYLRNQDDVAFIVISRPTFH